MRISVLTICFNSEAFIENAIQSVINQNYEDVEHIVIDGGSTDGTVFLLKKYDHLRWISEKDNGQSDAMNKAFEMSTGDLIVYLNADDYFEPNVFKEVVDFFKNSNADIVVGNLKIYNSISNSTKTVIPSVKFREIIFPNRYTFPYNPVSYFYYRRVQECIGEFPVREHYAMDYWFLIRAFDKFIAQAIDLTLGTFYLHAANKTVVNPNYNLKEITILYLRQKGSGLFQFKLIWLWFEFSRLLISGNFYKAPIKFLLHLFSFRRGY